MNSKKVCPICNVENDSTATHCIYCGEKFELEKQQEGAQALSLTTQPPPISATKQFKHPTNFSSAMTKAKRRVFQSRIIPISNKFNKALRTHFIFAGILILLFAIYSTVILTDVFNNIYFLLGSYLLDLTALIVIHFLPKTARKTLENEREFQLELKNIMKKFLHKIYTEKRIEKQHTKITETIQQQPLPLTKPKISTPSILNQQGTIQSQQKEGMKYQLYITSKWFDEYREILFNDSAENGKENVISLFKEFIEKIELLIKIEHFIMRISYIGEQIIEKSKTIDPTLKHFLTIGYKSLPQHSDEILTFYTLLKAHKLKHSFIEKSNYKIKQPVLYPYKLEVKHFKELYKYYQKEELLKEYSEDNLYKKLEVFDFFDVYNDQNLRLFDDKEKRRLIFFFALVVAYGVVFVLNAMITPPYIIKPSIGPMLYTALGFLSNFSIIFCRANIYVFVGNYFYNLDKKHFMPLVKVYIFLEAILMSNLIGNFLGYWTTALITVGIYLGIVFLGILIFIFVRDVFLGDRTIFELICNIIFIFVAGPVLLIDLLLLNLEEEKSRFVTSSEEKSNRENIDYDSVFPSDLLYIFLPKTIAILIVILYIIAFFVTSLAIILILQIFTYIAIVLEIVGFLLIAIQFFIKGKEDGFEIEVTTVEIK